MHMPIDMNNQPIINVGSPAGFKDVVSKTSLRILIKNSYIFGSVSNQTITIDGHSLTTNVFASNGLHINFDKINIKIYHSVQREKIRT